MIKTAADWARANDAVSFFDAGDVQANGFQVVEDDRLGRTFTETGASYMGFAVSALLATALASEPFYGLALTGDGSFMMNPQILIDGAFHGARGCILLLDNRRMGAISGLQEAQYGEAHATSDNVEVDYVRLAGAVQGVLALRGGGARKICGQPWTGRDPTTVSASFTFRSTTAPIRWEVSAPLGAGTLAAGAGIHRLFGIRSGFRGQVVIIHFAARIVAKVRQQSGNSDLTPEFLQLEDEARDEEKERMQVPNEMFIDGEWVPASDGARREIVNPATEEPVDKVPVATDADLDKALAAADHGWREWREVDAWTRSAALRRIAGWIRDRAEAIAAVMTEEQGKPIAEAKGEILAAADVYDWFADEARRIYGRVIDGHSRAHRLLVMRQPIGPVAAFSPWNFPMLLSSRRSHPPLPPAVPSL